MTKDANFRQADNEDSDQTTKNAPADLSLCWPHMSEGTVSHIPALFDTFFLFLHINIAFFAGAFSGLCIMIGISLPSTKRTVKPTIRPVRPVKTQPPHPPNPCPSTQYGKDSRSSLSVYLSLHCSHESYCKFCLSLAQF